MCVEQAGWGIGSGVMDKLGEHIRGWGSGFRKEKPIGLVHAPQTGPTRSLMPPLCWSRRIKIAEKPQSFCFGARSEVR